MDEEKTEAMAVTGRNPIQNPERLAAVRSTGQLDAPSDSAFDRIGGLAARVLNAPVMLISLLDDEREYFLSCVGLPPPWCDRRQTALSHSLGQYVVEAAAPYIVADASLEPALVDHGAVVDLGVAAYAGVPLDLNNGQIIGAFAAIDSVPRAWSDSEIAILEDLAALTITEIRLRQERTRPGGRPAFMQRVRLRQILDVIPEGILIAGPDQRFIMCNAAAVEILGTDVTTEDESMGALIGSFVPRAMDGAPIQLEEMPLARSLLRGETVRGERLLIRKANSDQDVPVLISSAQLRGADDTVEGVVAIFQDITEINRVDQQKDDFVATVSHDLKSPITAVQGHAQMLQRFARRVHGPDGKRLLDGLNRIESSSRQMVQILDDLVDLAYLAIHQQLAIRAEPTDLAALVRDTAADYSERAEAHPIRLEIEDELVGNVDGPRLRRVLDNLLSNAIKYSPEGGEIALRLARLERNAQPWVRIQVVDQGVGIPASDLPHIFDRYSRGGNVGGIKGTGLGLAGVRQIVLQHGGTTEIESQEQHGTTVTVELPLQPNES
jgi:PAS domain S-box-containing protein